MIGCLHLCWATLSLKVNTDTVGEVLNIQDMYLLIMWSCLFIIWPCLFCGIKDVFLMLLEQLCQKRICFGYPCSYHEIKYFNRPGCRGPLSFTPQRWEKPLPLFFSARHNFQNINFSKTTFHKKWSVTPKSKISKSCKSCILRFKCTSVKSRGWIKKYRDGYTAWGFRDSVFIRVTLIFFYNWKYLNIKIITKLITIKKLVVLGWFLFNLDSPHFFFFLITLVFF